MEQAGDRNRKNFFEKKVVSLVDPLGLTLWNSHQENGL